MALYHFRVKIHSRRQKVSAVARAAYRSGTAATSKATNQKTTSILRAAAYRSGGILTDKNTGERHDFSRKRGVEACEILAPANAPKWVYDRAQLWQSVEDAEVRKDARLAREAEISIPRELTPEQGRDLVRRFVMKKFVAEGMIADVAWHRVKSKYDGVDQPHAHVLLTTRAIGPDGWGQKPTYWNAKDLLKHWRAAWQDACNEALADAGSEARVDHRTLEAQEIDRRSLIYLGKAEHTKHDYDFARNRRERQQDVRDHNAGLDIGRAVCRVVAAGLEGGVGAAVLAGLGEVGILPEGATARGSIMGQVVTNVVRHVGA